MQPRDLWSPPVPQEYVISDTDQKIAEENARVQVFEHPAPPIPRRRKLFALIGEHKMGLLIVFVSVLLLGGGTALGIANLHKVTGNSPTVASKTSDSKKSSSSKTSTANSDEEDSNSSDTTDEDTGQNDSNAEDEGDNGDNGDNGSNGDSQDDGGDDDGGDAVDPGDDGDDKTPTPAPTPVPAKPTPATPHKFTVASWNVKTDNKKTVGTEVLDLLTKSQVIGLQTLRTKAMRESVKSKVICSSCAYAGYLASYSDSESGPADMPIIWNKSAFTIVGSGSNRKMCDAASSKSYSYAARYATWVKLQSKVNSKQFYVVDTHTMGMGESGGKPGSDSLLISRFQTHMTNLKALLAELQKSNIPIYLVGTFNVDYRYDRFGYTSYFPYTSLKAISVRSGWDLMGLSGISSSTGTDAGTSRLIDYVFTWQRSDVTANAIAVSTSTHGSDHYAAFLTSTIK
jgi:hypothetical protein